MIPMRRLPILLLALSACSAAPVATTGQAPATVIVHDSAPGTTAGTTPGTTDTTEATTTTTTEALALGASTTAAPTAAPTTATATTTAPPVVIIVTTPTTAAPTTTTRPPCPTGKPTASATVSGTTLTATFKNPTARDMVLITYAYMSTIQQGGIARAGQSGTSSPDTSPTIPAHGQYQLNFTVPASTISGTAEARKWAWSAPFADCPV